MCSALLAQGNAAAIRQVPVGNNLAAADISIQDLEKMVSDAHKASAEVEAILGKMNTSQTPAPQTVVQQQHEIERKEDQMKQIIAKVKEAQKKEQGKQFGQILEMGTIQEANNMAAEMNKIL